MLLSKTTTWTSKTAINGQDHSELGTAFYKNKSVRISMPRIAKIKNNLVINTKLKL